MNNNYLNGSPISDAEAALRRDTLSREARETADKTRAEYAPTGPHDVPSNHLEAGVTDAVSRHRPEWFDNLESSDYLGSNLPLQYAPSVVQDARMRMEELYGKLTAIDEVAEALCEEYHAQGADVKAAMVKAAEDGKDPGEKAKAIESKRIATATKYKDAVLKRDAFLEALGNVYRLVSAETRKGLPKWHDSMNKAAKELAAKAAPVLAESSRTLAPIMREALALTGHVEAARKGLGVEGVAPETLTDIAAVSRTLGAFEAAPILWDNMAADPVLSMTAAQYATAHEAPFDRKAYESREAAIEAFRQHYKVFGQQAMTREQAAALVDGKADLAPFGHSL
ncbi:hypothetical protein ABT084_13690 [Streptomyces sp. NPDC002138]|uniref:hypothetical protein n=1 Tax=Streptomyces sp. NPDC002138 TaxID=3154410 RepID=UPI00331D60C0